MALNKNIKKSESESRPNSDSNNTEDEIRNCTYSKASIMKLSKKEG